MVDVFSSSFLAGVDGWMDGDDDHISPSIQTSHQVPPGMDDDDDDDRPLSLQPVAWSFKFTRRPGYGYRVIHPA